VDADGVGSLTNRVSTTLPPSGRDAEGARRVGSARQEKRKKNHCKLGIGTVTMEKIIQGVEKVLAGRQGGERHILRSYIIKVKAKS
jgi:hypothetical protein